jgi:drug/metabolite transporter (DMT)-like permease
MTVHHSNLRGVTAMIASTGMFVVNDSFMKVAMDELPPFEVLFLRGVAATFCCTVLVLLFGQVRSLGSAVQPAVLGRAFVETLGVLCYIVALAHMPLADVVAISQTAPLMLILAAAFLLREPIGGGRLALIAVGFAGAVMVAQPSADGLSIYSVLAFATAAGIAGRDLVGRRVPSDIPAFIVALVTCFIVMVAAAIMTTLQEEWVAPSTSHLVYLLIAGLFIALGHFTIFLAYRFGSPSAVAPFFYAFAVWAVISGYLIWGEVPNLLAATGIALIVASGIAIILSDRRAGPALAARRIEAAGEAEL